MGLHLNKLSNRVTFAIGFFVSILIVRKPLQIASAIIMRNVIDMINVIATAPPALYAWAFRKKCLRYKIVDPKTFNFAFFGKRYMQITSRTLRLQNASTEFV